MPREISDLTRDDLEDMTGLLKQSMGRLASILQLMIQGSEKSILIRNVDQLLKAVGEIDAATSKSLEDVESQLPKKKA